MYITFRVFQEVFLYIVCDMAVCQCVILVNWVVMV